MLLHTPLRPGGASARPAVRFYVRMPRVSAYMVSRAVPAHMEDHVRGDAKFLGGGDAGDHTTTYGGTGLSLLQYPYIQSEATRRSSPERGFTDRVARRCQRRATSISLADWFTTFRYSAVSASF